VADPRRPHQPRDPESPAGGEATLRDAFLLSASDESVRLRRTGVNPPPGTSPLRPVVDAGRLWAGGAATALVAALVALVGVLIGDAVLEVEMVVPPLLPIGDSFALRYSLTAAA